ncbi:MAG: AAA family ATPase [Butyrivibrio sp.]|nr:AAA family ATPase [Butyrivibrio sp.]
MKLISCHIENFGKLQDFDYVFEGEKNVLHRDNGWGKSTLAAFIRVMFYGFLGENKRTIIDNERKRYRPWQMGVYGGSIVFCVKDREYRMERLFGEKKSGTDEFALYDNVTNLRSSDYSANVGEELFGIDLESFMRTVFIAQQDCGTEVTSIISAKIGNVADQTADMGNYNAVQNNLKKEMDRLTHERATGQLYKLDAKIAELRERVRSKDSLLDTRAELCRRLEEQRSSREETIRRQREIQRRLEQIYALKDSMAGMERYSELCEQVSIARKNYDDERNFFPGEVPSKDDLEALFRFYDDYESCILTAENFALSDEEKQELNTLDQRFEAGIPDNDMLTEIEDDCDRLLELTSDRDSLALSEAEKKKLGKAQRLFEHYEPALDEIDDMIAGWSARDSRKELVSIKKANAELYKSSHDITEMGVTNKAAEKLLIVIGLVAVLGGIACGVLSGEIIAGTVIAVTGALMTIAGVLSRRKNNKPQDQQAISVYERMCSEIREDEVFIAEVEETCRALFDKLHIRYDEEGVFVVLNHIRDLARDYEELSVRSREADLADKEEAVRVLELRISEFLSAYGLTDEADHQKAIFRLRNDLAAYGRLAAKCQTADEACVKAGSIIEEVRNYLISLGFTAEEDLKSQLAGINENYIRLNFSSRDLAEKEARKEAFEKENDVSGYASACAEGEKLSMEELSSSLNALQEQADSISEAEDSYRTLLEKNTQQLEVMENDEAELSALLTEQEYAQRKYRIISRTRDYLEKARQNFSGKYMEDIKASFDKYRRIISYSDEKYELDTDLNIKLKDKGSLHEIGYLSEGYKDLVGLCRRMAMVDAMYDHEKPFLIFDDPFVNLDEKRTAGATDFLNALAKEYQIIYFTCHSSRCGI